ncbi:protein of unknown function [Micropruina glycogenica]|uniref:Uncharacterized protein n=1 Tax=Micropruina glycogenica TaxID=75385 RepID=A0A2N9JLH9_9ACTN|nr:protein of unknown function [Micropruina glycogenica]
MAEHPQGVGWPRDTTCSALRGARDSVVFRPERGATMSQTQSNESKAESSGKFLDTIERFGN